MIAVGDWHSCLAAWRTPEGDGNFPDKDGRRHGADAGMFGAAPEEIAADMEQARRDGRLVESKRNFRCSTGRKGRINLGDIRIRA